MATIGIVQGGIQLARRSRCPRRGLKTPAPALRRSEARGLQTAADLLGRGFSPTPRQRHGHRGQHVIRQDVRNGRSEIVVRRDRHDAPAALRPRGLSTITRADRQAAQAAIARGGPRPLVAALRTGDRSSATVDAARTSRDMVGREQHAQRWCCLRSMRAIRIHVVCGNWRSAGPADIREIERDHAEAAGLQDQIHRFQRAIGVARLPESRADG